MQAGNINDFIIDLSVVCHHIKPSIQYKKKKSFEHLELREWKTMQHDNDNHKGLQHRFGQSGCICNLNILFKYSSAYTVLYISVSWNKTLIFFSLDILINIKRKLYLMITIWAKHSLLRQESPQQPQKSYCQSVIFSWELLQNIHILKNVKIISLFLCKKNYLLYLFPAKGKN